MKYIICIPIIFLWGLNPILTRISSNVIGIQSYIIITTIISSVSTIIIMTCLDIEIWKVTGYGLFSYHEDIKKRWSILFIDSIFCLSLPMILYNYLLNHTTSIAIIVMTTWYGAPLITSVLGIIVFKEYLSKLQVMGFVFCIIGVIMINIENIISEYKTRQYQLL